MSAGICLYITHSYGLGLLSVQLLGFYCKAAAGVLFHLFILRLAV